MSAPLRRLFDLPGVADLERAAVLKPLPGIGEVRPPDPDVDACAKALFGLTPDEAEAVARPDDWDGIEDRPVPRQVTAFEDAGLERPEEVTRTGRGFRDTVLALGGGRHPMDVFREFRGRTPSTATAVVSPASMRKIWSLGMGGSYQGDGFWAIWKNAAISWRARR